MHTWYCIYVHFWHIEHNLKTAIFRPRLQWTIDLNKVFLHEEVRFFKNATENKVMFVILHGKIKQLE